MSRKKSIYVLTLISFLSITLATMPASVSMAKSKTLSFSQKAKVQSVKAVSKTHNRIELKWQKMKGATGYQVYRATSKKGKYKKIATTKKTSLTNTKLKPEKKYYYKIRAYKKSNKSYKYSRFSSIICIKTSTKKQATTEKTTTEVPTTTEKTTTENSTTTETTTTTEKSTTQETTTTEKTTEVATQHVQDLNYEESTERINNPDQGFYEPLSVKVEESGVSYNATGINDYDQLYHLRIDISAFSKVNNGTEDKELTQETLNGINNLLTVLNNRNKNAIVRFAYDPSYNGAKDREPSLDMIVTHIKQLTPILNQYPDTITAVEVGLIGPYGEMHSSTLANAEAINTLIDTYLNNTSELPILVRTPAMIYNYLGITIDDIDNYTINATSEAYRLGIFNDGYLGTDADYGTYTNRTVEVPWLAKQTAHLPYGGEVTTKDGYELYKIETCLPEMHQLNLSYLNKYHNINVINIWKDTYYTSDIGNDSAYYDVSAYQYIENHLGYRFVLKNSIFEYSKNVSELNIKLDIQNVGFGNLNRTKQMSLLLVDDDDNTIIRNAGTFTGDSELSIQTPLSLPAGNYKVYLRIDNGNEKYPIQFANDDLWNSDLKANLIGFITKESN